MDSEKPYEPDSTTLEKDIRLQFRKDEDVLCLNNKDGCFYLGTIVEVDVIIKKCLVEYLDNTKTWVSFKDLRSFLQQETDICYVCKASHSKADNKIIVCRCGRSCHQLCHEPKITSKNWKCKICLPSPRRREEKSVVGVKHTVGPAGEAVISDIPPSSLSQLPYNPDTLIWDSLHRTNQEGHYCYCGGSGHWNKDMLQCRRCRQWFHATCTPSVSGPVFPGDRFFVFICSLCNHGKEYSRRLAMKWPDLVHLVLYNLTLEHQTKYYGLEEAILPFINKHWEDLRLPSVMRSASVDERRGQVMNALLTYEKRFKCGREIKKRANLWGLRLRGPPKAPPLSLPPRGAIDDNILKNYCKKNFVDLDYKPLQNGYINSSQAPGPCIAKSQNKIVPPLVINVPKPYSTSMTSRAGEEAVRGNEKDNLSTDSKVISSTEYHGRGLVKRSTPFPSSEQPTNIDTRFRSHAVRKARRLLNNTRMRKMKTVPSSPESVQASEPNTQNNFSHKNFSQTFEEFVENRQKRMEIREKGERRPEARKRPQRNLLEARLNSTESKLYNPQVEAEKKEKERKEVQDTSKRNKLKLNVPDPKGKPKLVQKTILDAFSGKSTDNRMKLELVPVIEKYRGVRENNSASSVKSSSNSGRRSGGSSMGRGDSDYSSDDASSRGTLEPFIPTPKDFEGQNNPFRMVSDLLNGGTANAGVPVIPMGPAITLPLPLKTVIPHTDPPRLKKRQLSEKDIIIDRNGQVKRRRRHPRRSQASQLAAQVGMPVSVSKTAQVSPSKNNKKLLQPLAANSAVDFALNVRQLRSREPTRPVATPTKSSPPKQSPSKESAPICEDLESSVKYFFGTASRIANGEKYEVKAKRITSEGRLQCIIDWKSLPT